MPEYRVIADSGCNGGTCPTVYAAPHLDDDVLVQGFIVTPEEAKELGVPAGETLVRVPRSLLTQVTEDTDAEG
jgi:hypothetical protein